MATELERLTKICEKPIDPALIEKARMKFQSFDKNKLKELQASIASFFLTDSIKMKTRQIIKRQMKKNDIIVIYLAFLGFICNILSSSYYITFETIDFTDKGINMFSNNEIPNSTLAVQILRFISFFSTILLLTFIFRHYLIRLKFMIYKQIVEITSTLISTKLIYYLICELILCSVHSPPFLDNIVVIINSYSGKPTRIDVDLILSSIIPIRA